MAVAKLLLFLADDPSPKAPLAALRQMVQARLSHPLPCILLQATRGKARPNAAGSDWPLHCQLLLSPTANVPHKPLGLGMPLMQYLFAKN